MPTQIKVPEFPESVDEGTLIAWAKASGDQVSQEEKLADVETDKVVLEVFATDSGTLTILKEEGEILHRGDVIGEIAAGGPAAGNKPAGKTRAKKRAAKSKAAEEQEKTEEAAPAPVEAPAANDGPSFASPSVRKLVVEHGINAEDITGSGKGGRILKADVEDYLENTPELKTNVGDSAPAPRKAPAAPAEPSALRPGERRVPMSQIRARIATRLVEVQQSAAILTTFNEVNMKPVMDIRAKYKDKFADIYGVKLGFMSFFVKAATEALKQFPEVNARIDGRDIIYNENCHVGIAVDSPRGLMVPVLREAETMTFADIEGTIRELAVKAKNAKLQYEELVGGTFTITNGGVFGSMLSTPILNAPQSAILGMHTIQQRPVAEDGQVVIRPMMYLALSYDHRIIDGRTAVSFLVAMKESLEDPNKLLIQL